METGKRHIDWEVISKSFRGELSEKEEAALESWLAASPRHRDFSHEGPRHRLFRRTSLHLPRLPRCRSATHGRSSAPCPCMRTTYRGWYITRNDQKESFTFTSTGHASCHSRRKTNCFCRQVLFEDQFNAGKETR